MHQRPETPSPNPTPAIVDGHVDLIYEMMGRRGVACFHELTEGPVTIAGLTRANVRIMVSALYCPDIYNGQGSAETYLKSLFHYRDNYLTGLKQIQTPQELEACYLGEAEPGIISLLENADALVDGGIDLDQLRSKGLKVIGLTHGGRNRIGDGNDVLEPSGLTREGRKLVGKLEQKGFALDVAHLSDPCFWEVAPAYGGPLLSSHTGFRFLCVKPRNLAEEQLELIFKKRGMVGVSVNPEMLSGDRTAGIEAVFNHIDWVVQRYGADCVGLGTDFCGFTKVNPDLEEISRLPALADILSRRGYPSEAITKIMGANWYRFYSSLLAN